MSEDNVEEKENISSHKENDAKGFERKKVKQIDDKPSVMRERKVKTTKTEGRKQDESMIDEPKRLVCHECRKPFASPETLRRHLLLCV